MEAYESAALTDQDPTLRNHVILASFSSIACRVFAVRRELEHEPQVIINFIFCHSEFNGEIARRQTKNMSRYPKF